MPKISAAGLAARGLKLPPFCEETLESKNWLKENVIKFAPFEIGAFMVYGIHEAACPPTEKIPVQVYAATAFGSEHQTTKMCLSLISRLYEDFPTPQKILDMGTGSGILSVAAAKIWHQTPQIIAADIDAEAVDVAASNAVTNGVEKNIAAILSDGYANPAIAARRTVRPDFCQHPRQPAAGNVCRGIRKSPPRRLLLNFGIY